MLNLDQNSVPITTAGMGSNMSVEKPDNERVMRLTESVKLTEEEAIEFLSNWNLVATYTLLDIDGFILNPINVSQKMSVTKSEAEGLIETLKNMNLIQESSGGYVSVPLYFDDSFVVSADLLNLYTKFSQLSVSKLTSKDIFSFRFDIMSRKVIQKYHADMTDLINRIANESKNETDCEVYASSFLFSKASKTKGGN